MTITINTTPDQDTAIAAENLRSNKDGKTLDLAFITSLLTGQIDALVVKQIGVVQANAKVGVDQLFAGKTLAGTTTAATSLGTVAPVAVAPILGKGA